MILEAGNTALYMAKKQPAIGAYRVHGTVPTGSISTGIVPTGSVPTSATPGHYTP